MLAGTSIALFWLRSAKSILLRGEKPAKLSPHAWNYAKEEVTLPQYDGYRWDDNAIGDIRSQAIAEAMFMLQTDTEGKWAVVRDHFSVRHSSDTSKA